MFYPLTAPARLAFSLARANLLAGETAIIRWLTNVNIPPASWRAKLRAARVGTGDLSRRGC